MIPDSPAGPISEIRTLAGSLLQHVMGLISLAGWEGREASNHYFWLTLTLLGSIFFLALGYLFLLIFFVFVLSQWYHVQWIWIALTLAAIHGFLAILGILVFTRNVGKSIFASTISEIKRDLETLNPPPLP